MLTNLLKILLLVGAAYWFGHHQAYKEVEETAHRIEAEMVVKVEEANTKLAKEKQDAQTKISSLQSAVADGTLRLSVLTRSTSPSADGNTEARAELDTKTANDLISITADGDQAIRELNACIDIYNKLRNTK